MNDSEALNKALERIKDLEMKIAFIKCEVDEVMEKCFMID